MRYKEYNRNAVLEKAIRLFWQMGFNGCSINDIVKETGVNRFSLYHEFGSKEGILYASLELYRERYTTTKFDILRNAKDNLQATLIRFYMAFLEDDSPISGCYFIHVGTELADSDDQVRESLNTYLKDIQLLMKNALLKTRADIKDVERQAKHLLGLFCTAMSFCLIQTPEERREYVTNGIHIILSSHAESIKQ